MSAPIDRSRPSVRDRSRSSRLLSAATLLATTLATTLLAHPAAARGTGDCESPMHFTTISHIKCDHFGTAKTPWMNAVAELEGAPVSCLSIINLGQDALFNAGSTFDAYGSTEQDGNPVDWILVGLVSGMTQPGRSTVTSSTGACVLHFSVDVVVRDWAFPFDDTDWV